MPKLLLATSNLGKQREYCELLAGVSWELVTPQELSLSLTVDETGDSYEANAIMKARSAAAASELMALADDSGLEVDALGGAPGLLSARFAGEGADDRRRWEYLLARLEGVPPERRTARFRCVIAIARPTGEVVTCEGTVDGFIAQEPRGEGGFGYDPIFLLPERALTLAELPPEEKNAMSHRGRAAEKARGLLAAMLAQPSTGSG